MSDIPKEAERMATDRGFIEYVTEQLQGAGSVRAKRMFGEYGLFCDGLFFAVVCADQLFIKPTEAARSAFPDLPMAPPYEGAKDYILVEDIDDAETLMALASLTCEALRASERPKRRKYGCI